MSGYELYDGRPPRVDERTSGEAADSMLPVINTLQAEVFRLISIAGSDGMTCDEVENLMDGRHQTISARIRELSQMNMIRDSGKVRKTRSGRNARVYVRAERDPVQLALFG